MTEKKLYNAPAERGLLACMCQFGGDSYYEFSDILAAGDMADDNNQLVYRTLQNLIDRNSPIDIPSILSSAKELGFEQKLDNKDTLQFVRSLFQIPVKKESAREHAQRIKKLSIGREAQAKHRAAYYQLEQLTGSETINDIVGISEKPLLDLSFSLNNTMDSRPMQIAEGGLDLLQDLMDNPIVNIGIPTPYARYNQAIGGGLRVGGVNLIAARPKTGKTTLGKEIALHVASLGIPVLYLDTEMDKKDQYFRSLASLSKVEISKIETGMFGKNPAEKERILRADAKLREVPYKHLVVAGKPFEEILSSIRRWILKDVGHNPDGSTKPCLVIYDYFKLMNAEILRDMDEYQALGFQIGKLSDFSKLYQFSCLAFVQINRDGITKETSDILAGSDRLLWLCHSCSIYKKKTAEEVAQSGKHGNMKFIPLDCRYGGSMEEGDFIHFKMDGARSIIEENLSNREILQSKDEVDDSDDSDPL